MTAYKCDRCKKFYDKGRGAKVRLDANCNIFSNAIMNNTKDICPDCYTEIASWMKAYEIPQDSKDEAQEH